MATIRMPLYEFGNLVDNNLEEAIINEEKKTAKYIPHSVLKKYWTRQRVQEILNLHTGESIDIKIDNVLNDYIVIFSILVYISSDSSFRVRDIELFIQSNLVSDLNLPLDDARADQIYSHCQQGQESWELFKEYQFIFSPVRLGPNLLHKRELLTGSILPLDCGETIPGSEGNGSLVRKYTVKNGSDLRRLRAGDTIAVKEIVLTGPDGETTFKNELAAYTTIENTKMSNSNFFLEYYGSFKLDGKGYILLEYANQGNLDDFFSRNDIPNTRVELCSLWKELLNLVRGLILLHNLHGGGLHGIHQDLKPSNIFVFKHEDEPSSFRYSFKIGDFGLSSFRVGQAPHPDNKTTRIYGAPELANLVLELAPLRVEVTPAADIWSLGCVFLDVLVWQVWGDRGRTIFFNRRVKAVEHKPRLYDAGYSGAFHDGLERLNILEETLEEVFLNRRFSDDLTEPLAHRIFLKMLSSDPTRRLPASLLEIDLEDFLTRMERNGKQAPDSLGDDFRSRAMQNSGIFSSSNSDHQLAGDPVTPVRRRGTIGPIRHTESPDNMYTGDNHAPSEAQFLDGLHLSNPPRRHHQASGQLQQASDPTLPSRHQTLTGPQISERPNNGPRSQTVHGGNTAMPALAGFQSCQNTTTPNKQAHRASEPPLPTARNMLGMAGSQHFSDLQVNASSTLREQLAFHAMNDPRPSTSRHTAQSSSSQSRDTLFPRNGDNIRRSGSHQSIKYTMNEPRLDSQLVENSNPTIRDVLEWKKKNRSERKPLCGQKTAARALDNREYIFIVDDSNSMVKNPQRWRQVSETVEALAYLVKDYDKTGTELYLASDPTRYARKAPKGHSNELFHFVSIHGNTKGSVPNTNMELSLDKVLEKAKVINGTDHGPSRGSRRLRFRGHAESSSSVSIYILTDAMWDNDHDDGRPAVTDSIRRLIQQMKVNHRPRTSVMIQFIQFGDDPAATRRLQYLDDELGKDLDFDIVDTKTVDHDVWQILIGSINRSNDRIPAVNVNSTNSFQPETHEPQGGGSAEVELGYQREQQAHGGWGRSTTTSVGYSGLTAFSRHPECRWKGPEDGSYC